MPHKERVGELRSRLRAVGARLVDAEDENKRLRARLQIHGCEYPDCECAVQLRLAGGKYS